MYSTALAELRVSCLYVTIIPFHYLTLASVKQLIGFVLENQVIQKIRKRRRFCSSIAIPIKVNKDFPII